MAYSQYFLTNDTVIKDWLEHAVTVNTKDLYSLYVICLEYSIYWHKKEEKVDIGVCNQWSIRIQ